MMYVKDVLLNVRFYRILSDIFLINVNKKTEVNHVHIFFRYITNSKLLGISVVVMYCSFIKHICFNNITGTYYFLFYVMLNIYYFDKWYSRNICTKCIWLFFFQDSIQKILLCLAMKLNTEHRLHEKRRIFLMYQLFVKLLLKEFNQQLGGSWAYVLRETIYRLLYIAKDVLKLHQ